MRTTCFGRLAREVAASGGRCRFVGAVLAGLILTGGPVRAEEDAAQEAKARILAGNAHRKADELVQARDAYKRAIALLRGENLTTRDLADALDGLGKVLQFQDRPADALPLHEQALAIRRRLTPDDHARIASTLSDLAVAYRALGKHKEAVQSLEQSIALQKSSGDSFTLAVRMSNLAAAYDTIGRSNDALPVAEEALAMARRLSPGDAPLVEVSLSRLAGIADSLGQHERALRLHKEATQMSRRLGLEARTATHLANAASTLRRLGRTDESLGRLREALDVEQALYGTDHPRVASTLGTMALTLRDAGRYADALPVAERALVITRKAYPGDHRRLATAIHNAALVLANIGKHQRALALAKEAVDMNRRIFGTHHPDIATNLGLLGSILQSLGRLDEAAAAMKEALALVRRAFPGDHPRVANRLNGAASILSALGKDREALPLRVEALDMVRRLFGPDHPAIPLYLSNLASSYAELGQHQKALPLRTEALQAARRRFPSDHLTLLGCIHGLARTLGALARHGEALGLRQEALAMARRLYEGDHEHVATMLSELSTTLRALGQTRAALDAARESLAIERRLFAGDHPSVAQGLLTLAHTLNDHGQHGEALTALREAVAMNRRLYRSGHVQLASSLNGLGLALHMLGRDREAARPLEEALAMVRRLFPEDHEAVAAALNNLAMAYTSLGRDTDALPLKEESAGILRRMFPGDHVDVAKALANLAETLQTLGHSGDALALEREALAMCERLLPEDHRTVATLLNHVAHTLCDLDRTQDALPLVERSLAISRRLHTDDHPQLADALHSAAFVHRRAGMREKARALEEASLHMRQRIFGNDHPLVARGLLNIAHTLVDRGKRDEAKQYMRQAIETGRRVGWSDLFLAEVTLGRLLAAEGASEQAIRHLESAVRSLESRRSGAALLGSRGRARYMNALRRNDPFPALVDAYIRVDRVDLAFDTLERSRGREMLTLLERGEFDTLAQVMADAQQANDEALLARVDTVQKAVRAAESALVLAQRETRRAVSQELRSGIRHATQVENRARSDLEKARRDRLRLLQRALPEGTPLSAAQVKGLLAHDERLVAYSLGRRSFVFVVSPTSLRAFPLRRGAAYLTRESIASRVAAFVHELSEPADRKSIDGPSGAALFRDLVPKAAWEEIRAARRVFVLPHGVLHRMPFEALVVAHDRDEPVYWLDQGPPLSYASSAAVLRWLRSRPVANDIRKLVMVGDPAFDRTAPWPAHGLVVVDVAPGLQASQKGLRRGDVVLSYDETPVETRKQLHAAIDGSRAKSGGVPLTFERDGIRSTLSVTPGRLGIDLARDPPPIAGPKLLHRSVIGSVSRHARRAARGRLPGAQREVRRVEALAKDQIPAVEVRTLIGAEATETRLFEAATSPTILHLATHGVGEAEGQEGHLLLAPPRVPSAENDGLLTMRDLVERWRHRLDGTALVVLSACDSRTGRLERNEGMFAMPVGFFVAGAQQAAYPASTHYSHRAVAFGNVRFDLQFQIPSGNVTRPQHPSLGPLIQLADIDQGDIFSAFHPAGQLVNIDFGDFFA